MNPYTDALFVFATDGESLKITMRSIKDYTGVKYLITNGYEYKTNKLYSSFDEILTCSDIREGYNKMITVCINGSFNAVLIRSGSVVNNLDKLIEQGENYGMVMSVILDPSNTQFELSNSVAGAFPIPSYNKGNRIEGTVESFWLDGPVIYIQNKVFWDNGLIDMNLTEHFSIVDYSIKARWAGNKTAICHDSTVVFVNELHFTSVLKGVETGSLIVGQYVFARKYGGAILNSLTGK